MFNGSPEDLARLIAALAAGEALLTPGSEAAGIRRVDSRPEDGPRPGGGGSLLLVSVPGLGLVGAAIAPPGAELLTQGLARFPPGETDDAEDGEGGVGAAAGRAMHAAMEQVLRVVMERSLQEQGPSVHPAKETMRDALPRVVVTKEDQLDEVNSKCAVCLEEYRAGMRATRMFCGHLFCTNCIREWLRTANTCPICRFELATDCEEYEQGRVERMRGRIAKLKGGELRMMRVPELKRLMRALGVSGEGCVEKADLIRQLGAAPGIELTGDASPSTSLFYDESELRCLEMPLLRSLLERHSMKLSPTGVEMDEVEERAAVLDRFASAGWLRRKQPPRKLLVQGARSSTTLGELRPSALLETPLGGMSARAASDLLESRRRQHRRRIFSFSALEGQTSSPFPPPSRRHSAAGFSTSSPRLTPRPLPRRHSAAGVLPSSSLPIASQASSGAFPNGPRASSPPIALPSGPKPSLRRPASAPAGPRPLGRGSLRNACVETPRLDWSLRPREAA